MSTERNPHRESRRQASEQTEFVKLKGGVVTNAPVDVQDGHGVEVRPDGMERSVACVVAVGADGDVYVPPSGSDVVIGFRRRNAPVIVASEYTTDEQLPSTSPGERRLSHPLSDAEVYFDDSGVLHVVGDSGTEVTIQNGEIHLDGSSQGVITDVQAGGTNSEGGITSLDITRSSTVKL